MPIRVAVVEDDEVVRVNLASLLDERWIQSGRAIP